MMSMAAYFIVNISEASWAVEPTLSTLVTACAGYIWGSRTVTQALALSCTTCSIAPNTVRSGPTARTIAICSVAHPWPFDILVAQHEVLCAFSVSTSTTS
jgi:hypothetical protein